MLTVAFLLAFYLNVGLAVISDLPRADPGMAMDLELSITGAQPGHISHTLLCIVGSLQQPLHLLVDANIKVGVCVWHCLAFSVVVALCVCVNWLVRVVLRYDNLSAG